MLWFKLRRSLFPEKLLTSGKSRRASTITNAIRKTSNTVVECKLNVNGLEINYPKTESGSHAILMLPGTMGSIWTDFKPQIENLNKSKMTIVAWDPPGYGMSRPPDRTFPENFLKHDAIVAHDLMKAIGFEDFSLMSWSAGGTTLLIFAANHPNSIRRVITIAGSSYIKPSKLKMYERLRNLGTWSVTMKALLLSLYGEGYLRATWTAMINTVADICQRNDGDVCKGCLPRIRCPTLLAHDAKDVITELEHAEFLNENIADSRFKVFENAGCNLHLQYHEKFNELAMKFVLETD